MSFSKIIEIFFNENFENKFKRDYITGVICSDSVHGYNRGKKQTTSVNSNTLTFFKILANYCVQNDYICSIGGPLFQFLMFVIHSNKLKPKQMKLEKFHMA